MKLFKIILLAIVVILSVCGTIIYSGYKYFRVPIIKEDSLFVVDGGDNFNEIVSNLLRDKIILKNKFIFTKMAKFYPSKNKLRTGEYLFKKNSTLLEILKQMKSGKIYPRKVTIAEGTTNNTIFKIIDKADGLTGEMPSEDDFLEGTLLPDTYIYKRGDTKKDIILRMQKAMVDFVEKNWNNRAEDLPYTTKQELLSLASIVEKETGLATERGKVASVFVNRLKRKMRLQSDPTVVYAFTRGDESLRREIRRSDLDFENEYNTYKINGIPKKPIANPGKETILATLKPEKTNFLYFVATGNGGHSFTSNLKDHNKKVQDYRNTIKDK